MVVLGHKKSGLIIATRPDPKRPIAKAKIGLNMSADLLNCWVLLQQQQGQNLGGAKCLTSCVFNHERLAPFNIKQ